MKDLLMKLWQHRICNYFTIFGVFCIYMAWFQSDITKQFLTFIFLDVGEKAINKIISEPAFTTTIVTGIGGLFVWFKSKGGQNDK